MIDLCSGRTPDPGGRRTGPSHWEKRAWTSRTIPPRSGGRSRWWIPGLGSLFVGELPDCTLHHESRAGRPVQATRSAARGTATTWISLGSRDRLGLGDALV